MGVETAPYQVHRNHLICSASSLILSHVVKEPGPGRRIGVIRDIIASELLVQICEQGLENFSLSRSSRGDHGAAEKCRRLASGRSGVSALRERNNIIQRAAVKHKSGYSKISARVSCVVTKACAWGEQIEMDEAWYSGAAVTRQNRTLRVPQSESHICFADLMTFLSKYKSLRYHIANVPV